ncbi:shikimate dehydrogenase [Butyrivibrio sp. CB08]|uniref:shikimate kinase n=1 Tax=Butyrivibrio sp. CB08 TaxID=2364879 RepID=UPI000EAAB2AB|nr:shikimate kinase [Butyrivibrio sp. CB08]RKM61095.1 shikimate dehydrogenase [Butyrivibrio sp. CB08]
MLNYTDGNTTVCGIIGNPVRHTMSPLIHNTLADMTGNNLVYVPFEVPEGGLKNAVRGAYELGIKGMNVTVPYKSDVIAQLKYVDPLAESIGAVNTLVRDEALKGYRGYNTDMTGLYRAMQKEGVELEGETVVILGAGGVARPTAHLCIQKGAAKVYILNRTLEKAVAIAEELGDERVIPMDIADYTEVLTREKSFFAIQCTSVGLFPDVNSAVIEDEEFYRHVSAALDVIYKPLETKFLKLSKAAGAKTFSGLKMLLYQGLDAYELWNQDAGIKITDEQADRVYKSLILEVTGARNIILEGFMGSGKTTVSEILADKLDLDILDTDKAIEETEGRAITDIFREDGEEAFRNMETELLDTIVSDHWRDMVISLGGGLPVREENRKLLAEAGKVIYLRTSPEEVYKRIMGDTTRPLLQTEDPLARIRELQDARSELYELAADIVIDTDGKEPLEVASEIIDKLGI